MGVAHFTSILNAVMIFLQTTPGSRTSVLYETERLLGPNRRLGWEERSLILLAEIKVYRTLDDSLAIFIWLVDPRLETEYLPRLGNVISSGVKCKFDFLLVQTERAFLATAGSPCEEFSNGGEPKSKPRREHPNTAEWGCIASSYPVHPEKCPRRRRFIVGDVESLTIDFGRIRIPDSIKQAMSTKQFYSRHMADIHDIHIDVVVTHPEFGLFIIVESA